MDPESACDLERMANPRGGSWLLRLQSGIAFLGSTCSSLLPASAEILLPTPSFLARDLLVHLALQSPLVLSGLAVSETNCAAPVDRVLASLLGH